MNDFVTKNSHKVWFNNENMSFPFLYYVILLVCA